jgi:hypothetical protein
MVVLESVLAASLSAFIMSQIAQAHARKIGRTKEEMHEEAAQEENHNVAICHTERRETESLEEIATGKPAIIKDSSGQVRRAIVFEDLIELSSLKSSNETCELPIEGKDAIVGSPNNTRQARLAIVFDEFVDPRLFSSQYVNGSNLNIEITA